MNQPRLYEPAYQSPAQLAQLEHQNRMAEFIGHVDRSMRHNFAALMESIRLLRVDNAELKTELTFHIRQKQRLSRRTERYRKEVSELKAGTRWTRKVAKPGNKGLLQVKVSTDLPCTSQAASAREEQAPQAQEESKLTRLKSRLNWETRGPKEGIVAREKRQREETRERQRAEKRERQKEARVRAREKKQKEAAVKSHIWVEGEEVESGSEKEVVEVRAVEVTAVQRKNTVVSTSESETEFIIVTETMDL